MIRTASPLLAALLLACTVAGVPARLAAQTETPETPFAKQLHKIDLGITGVGEYNSTVSGPLQIPAGTTSPIVTTGNTTVTQFGSNTFGALITLRYIAKPYVGFELNYGYARYTENYSVAPYQIQTKASEYTLGYIATPNQEFLGVKPYLGAGAGSLAFKPTPHGGQGAPEQARAVYYYTLGVQKDFASGHLGLRAGFREIFFLDPDFGQNYLTILKHANTYEPQAGFYLRY